MREEFTDNLRRALDKAQDEARALNQDFVGTEHLLLGILEVEDSEAVAGLRLANVGLRELREKLVEVLPKGAEDPVVTGSLPLSPKARRVVNGALVNAQTAGLSRVSSRMLLVSLLDDCETVVRSVLRGVGADIEHLQRVLVQDGAIPPEG
jgi:ATP-dependent Clp protease ATP-binding subunit ClpC